MFKGAIYDPVLLEINVKDRKNAKYIENVVAVKDLIGFICVETEDVDLLKKEMCFVRKLKINIAECKNTTATPRPDRPIEQLKYGITFLIHLGNIC